MSRVYEFRVDGHLDGHWSTLLAGLVLSHGSDGTSTLTGPVADQAELHGVLAGLRDLGAPLVAVRALPSSVGGVAAPLADLTWPKRTARLALRPARPEDAETTWRFRRLESVCRWLTEVPTDLKSYRATLTDPARLATTLVIELDGEVIGDLMLRVEDASSQKRSSRMRGAGTPSWAGCSTRPSWATDTQRRRSASCCRSASTTWSCAG